MAAPIRTTFCNLFSRLDIAALGSITRTIHTQNGPQLFRVTTCLSAAPMKKKKKMDMNVFVQKELKKRRKIERAIERIQRKGRILKPVLELEVDRDLMKTIDQRKREIPELTYEESENLALMRKQITKYKRSQYVKEMVAIRIARTAQDRALQHLRNESEELYQMAIQCDEELIPLTFEGPSYTPQISNYVPADGEYKDTTPTYERPVSAEDVERVLKK